MRMLFKEREEITTMKTKDLILITALSVFIGAISTWGIMSRIHHSALRQEANLQRVSCEAKLCGGEDFGQVRVNMVQCAGETELCICGDPSMLNKGL
jgi:hypothetical protein